MAAQLTRSQRRRLKNLLYLTGAVYQPALAHRQIGLILTPDTGNHVEPALVTWAADNACFAQGARFSLSRYYDWLDKKHPYHATCLFATAPDVLCDAQATLERSLPVLPVLRQKGWRAALVAQNGLESLRVPWGAFDCLFLGGDTAWKLGPGAAALACAARAKGKWVHMGRVNSEKRVLYAHSIGCHSVDGTFLKFAPDKNWLRLQEWLRHPRALESVQARQGHLWEGVGA